MTLVPVNPGELGPPRGYNNGLRGRGELLFVAGQVGWGSDQRLVSADFAAQFTRAVDNILAVVQAAGGRPHDVARMTVYVIDKQAYVEARAAIGSAWRERFGRHYPAMALVEVRSLLESGALVEIEATALLPDRVASWPEPLAPNAIDPTAPRPTPVVATAGTVSPPRSFRYVEDGGVARITLDRPQAMNALTFEVYRELTDTFRALATRQGLRCAVITGSGRAFCTGGDVNDIIGPLLARDRAALHAFTTMTCDLIRAMRALPFPIVASLNGPVAGAGAVIAIASDFRVAALTAKIAFLFVKVGLAGADMGAAWLLPRLIGQSRATELLMLGDFVDAAEAHRIGLYHRVCPPERLAEETDALVARVVAGPAAGLAATRDALDREAHMTLEEALRHEAHVQAELMPGDDFAEGHRAFVEKRPPRFTSPRGERP